MGIPLVQGRFFTEDDFGPTSQAGVIIDQPFAKRFWPNGDAIGKQVWTNPARKETIVGVVGMVRQYGLNIEPRIVMYRPSETDTYHVARTSADPAAVAGAIARTIREADPSITVFDVRTIPDRMSDSLARQRFSTLMLGAFATFALVLAVIGVYGVLSHLVAHGARDIGVRMALGAEQSSILLMVLRQGLALTGTGIVIGLIGAVALTRVMASLLFGVSTTDPLTFLAVPLLLVATAVLASYVPARRATRVNPVVVLRDE
jgi:predicted permease